VEREPVNRRMAAILAADIVGYSRLMRADEEGTLVRLKAHRRELVDPKVVEHRHRVELSKSAQATAGWLSPRRGLIGACCLETNLDSTGLDRLAAVHLGHGFGQEGFFGDGRHGELEDGAPR
jgi:class 3 adenylate cyclase